jgi:hypothetical protein
MARIFQDGAEMGVPASSGSNTYADSMWWQYRLRGHNYAGTTNPASGTYSFIFTGVAVQSSNNSLRRDLGENYKEHYGRVECAPGMSTNFIRLNDANGDLSMMMGNSSGDLVIYLGGAVEIGRISGALVADGVTYNRIEWRLLVDSENGVIEVKVNGNSLFSYNNDTQGARMESIRSLWIGTWAGTYGNYIIEGSTFIDDVAINDTTGTVNNSWCGKGSILLLKPKAAGAHTDFTPNANNNWEQVNEVPHDGDTTYVYSETADHIDTYDLEELEADHAVDPTDAVVKAVQVCLTGRYEGADAHLAPMLRHGTTDHEGDQMTMANSYYRLHNQVFSISPFTSAAWTITEVDALEAGVKHKAHTE